MKFSLNHLKRINQRYDTTGDISAIGVEALADKIGAQLGAVDEIIDVGSKYGGALIVKVVDCEKHPNADKLSVCLIDDGGAAKNAERDKDGLVRVVCGAPNVHAGMLAVWLSPGSTVPETVGKDPFVLEARELRGVVSNGMLASPKELALGDSHAGILEVPGDIKPGSDFAEVFGFKDDVVFDIENKLFTHRPDCFGWLGIDRELAGIQGMTFKSPDWYVAKPEFPKAEAAALPLKIVNELPELVPRFTAAVLTDVQVGPSDAWVQAELAKHGLKAINNIVDYTNFFMLLTGQPLHAYDYDKVKALSGGEPTIVVRNPKPGETLKLLNGKQIEPRSEAIMIATDKQLIGVGGVMGGSETEVDETTQTIILECASFDMYSVRRTSMAHGLFTDAVTRFTKGQSPLQNLAVLARVVGEIVRSGTGVSYGKLAGEVLDDNHLDPNVLDRGSLYVPVTVSVGFINERLGLSLTAEEITKLLVNVEFKVEAKGEELIVSAPFWRTDIELREDVVEEVGRLYGYDHLPLELPKRDLTPTDKDELLTAKSAIRDRLAAAGANEVLTYSFVHGDLLKKTGQDSSKTFEVANALSPDLQHYRVSLMPSLLEKVHPNIKAGYDRFALFEIGRTHSTDHVDQDGLPEEFEFTALVVTAADKLKQPGAAYYEARKYLSYLAHDADLVFKPIDDAMLQYPVVQPYDRNRAALVSVKNGDFLGIIGEFKPSVTRNLKLPKHTAGFEIDTKAWLKQVSLPPAYNPLPRFPSVSQDLSLKVPAAVDYQTAYDFVDREFGANAIDNTHIELSPVDIYQPDDATKHYTFRLTVTSYERTLTDKEVGKVLDAIAASAKTGLKAERL